MGTSRGETWVVETKVGIQLKAEVKSSYIHVHCHVSSYDPTHHTKGMKSYIYTMPFKSMQENSSREQVVVSFSQIHVDAKLCIRATQLAEFNRQACTGNNLYRGPNNL